MNYSENTLNGTVELLIGTTDMHTLTPVKVVPADGATSTVVYAGTPLTLDGEVVTPDNLAEKATSLAGILLYDVDTALNPNATMVQSGPIDGQKALVHSGFNFTKIQLGTIMSALSNIIFRTNVGVNE